MTQKHTPGPWYAGFDLYNVGSRENNTAIMRVIYDDKERIVANLSYHTTNDKPNEDRDAAISANAALIAAAPDLLEVAKMEEALELPHEEGLLVLIGYGFDHINRFDYPATKFVSDKRKAAIAKAEGK